MIAAIRQRLADQVGALKFVAGAVEFAAAAEANPPAVPAAYVLPLAEKPGPNEIDNGVEQRIAVEFGVVLVVRNLGDAKGAAAAADLETLRAAVKGALVAWSPLATHEAIERGPSHLLAFRDQHVWWQDQFATTYYERSA